MFDSWTSDNMSEEEPREEQKMSNTPDEILNNKENN